MSTLYQQWQNIAYDETADRSQLEKFWGTYFQIEKEIYEKLLSNPDEAVKGTVKELAEKYETEVLIMTGFLDGINEMSAKQTERLSNSLLFLFQKLQKKLFMNARSLAARAGTASSRRTGRRGWGRARSISKPPL